MHEHDDAPSAQACHVSEHEEEAAKTPTTHGPKQPLARALLQLVLDSDAVLFHDQFHEAYIAPHGNGCEVIRLRSRQFRSWLHYHAHTVLEQPVTPTVALEAIYTMEGHAQHAGPLHPLAVRVAASEGALWYDLGGKAVRVTAEGWDVIDRPPILFRRFHHQQAQVAPQRGGTLALLAPLLSSSMTDAQQLLFTVSLVTGLVPDIPQTVDVIFGDHGSAKSTLTKVKKALLDPSVLDECTPPTSVHEFIQLLAHHWYVPLGNLTSLPGWMSDCISRASTGSGFAKRELYTDDDDVIYRFFRIVGLNGINLVADKADLLDRALLIGDLGRIPETARREETVVWQQFEQIKPAVLGAMFDALAGAMHRIAHVTLTHAPRMADFTRWGCAVAEAMRGAQEAFLRAYQENIARQHDEAIDASPIGTAIVVFMEHYDVWEGSPSALLAALQPIAEDLQLEHQRSFPQNARWVWRRLKEVKVNLNEKGITCAYRRAGTGERLIRLSKGAHNDVGNVAHVEPMEW